MKLLVESIKTHVANSSWMLKWVLLLSGYLSILTFLISSTSNSTVFFYVLIVGWSLYSYPQLIVKSVYKKAFLLSICISSLIYAYLLPLITNIELWGDEIEEIKAANYQFGEIYSHVKIVYYASPPFGFWGLWVWNHFASLVPIQYHEFFYRVPYMVVHSISSGLFGIIVLKITKENATQKWQQLILFLLAYLSFFANPVLFFYSIEVRSYVMTILGSLIVLYFYLFTDEFKKRDIFLFFFFCLHAIVQFLILVPFWFKLFLQNKKERLFAFMVMAATVILALILKSALTPPKATSPAESFRLIKYALSLFISLQFSTVMQIFALISIVLFLLVHKDKRIIPLICYVLFFVFSVSGSALVEKYFDFNVRHLSFIAPWVTLLLFYPLLYLKKHKKSIFIILLFTIFTIPWARGTYNRLNDQNLFSKALIGAKQITVEAKSNNKTMILLPISTTQLPLDVYEFERDTFTWYASRYKIAAFTPDTEQHACDLFQKLKNSLLINSGGDIDCLQSVSQQYFFGTAVKEN